MTRIVFVSGGVRSGKSAFAEEYIHKIKGTRQAVYIASGVAFDEEMNQRILRHQQDRLSNDWQTIEVPTVFPPAFQHFTDEHVLLWDCLTTWVTNILVEELPVEKYMEHLKEQLHFWRKRGITVVLVSNEVLDAGISSFTWTAEYQRLLGQLHIWLVEFCDEAYELDYRLVKRWKS